MLPWEGLCCLMWILIDAQCQGLLKPSKLIRASRTKVDSKNVSVASGISAATAVGMQGRYM